MHGEAVLVPIVAVVVSLGAPVLIVYFALKFAQHRREMLNKERMMAIEKGFDVPLLDTPKVAGSTSPLSTALVLIAVGVGATLALLPMIGFRGPALLPAVAAAAGLAKLIHWFLGGKEEWTRQRELDEELRRAYVDRLRSGGSNTRQS